MTEQLLSLYLKIKDSFRTRGVIFFPRDIGMWREPENGLIDPQRFSSLEEFMTWLRGEFGVSFDDHENPFKLVYDKDKDRFAVIQWTVIGWLHVK